MNIVIVDYNAGNIHSVRHALNRLGIDPVISDDPQIIVRADKIILPGVGEARSAMEYLSRHDLIDVLKRLKQPVLGICLGLQLMCAHSEENQTRCLGIFPCAVKKYPPAGKVPHMGWNSISQLHGKLYSHIPEDSYVYFVHSYYAAISHQTIAITEYIVPFSASLKHDNYYAVQFHPEKSGIIGQTILRNFIEL